MTAPVSLVVTDLDGTFWLHDHDVPAATVAAARRLAELGVPLLVATGRRLSSTRRPLGAVGLAPPSVVLNGALGVDLVSGERFHRAPFPDGQAATVLEACRSVGCDPVVYVDDPEVDAYIAPEPTTHPGHVAGFGDAVRTADLARVVAEQPVLGFSMIGVPFDVANAAVAAIDGRAETHVDRSIDYEGTASFTCAPRGQSKWDGVLAFCAVRGLDADRVLALADGPNDLELLDRAAVRLVPEVAHPAALERADHVIPPAGDGGWAAVLEHVAVPG